MATTSSSLKLSTILKAGISRTGLGLPGGTVSGLVGSAQALFAAAVQASPVIFVVPTDADVEAMTADVSFFLAGLEGRSAADVARQVVAFPSHEVDPYRGLTPHFDVTSARARALHGLATGTARIVVASVAALYPRVSSPERLLAAAVVLKPGDDISPQRLGDILVDGGFWREDPVDEHGEFCVRGGVVDVFPADEDHPVRIEFVGDMVESVRRYDPATQRSTEGLDVISLVPLEEVPGIDPRTSEGVTADPLHARAVVARAWLGDYVSPGERPTVLVSEVEQVVRIGQAHAEQLEVSHGEALNRGRDLPDPDSLTVGWAAIEELIAGATRLVSLSVDTAAESPESDVPTGGGGGGRAESHRRVPCQPALEFRGRVGDWATEVGGLREAGETVVLVAATTGRADRCIELLGEYGIPAGGSAESSGLSASVFVTTGSLTRGFRLPTARLQFYSETDVFEEERHAGERRRSAARTFMSDFRDLKAGDLVVHADHGVGTFVGLTRIDVAEDPHEFMELRYADDNKLFVPVERLDLVQKYSGALHTSLDRLGGTTWERAKTRVRRAMQDMAEELLKLYAARKAISGHAFAPDSHWQQEFEDAFDYEVTSDQAAAIADIRSDMEASYPMDRLLCGDVGYGKTEVAMRAAFKAVMDGKQVAFLAPTTVLAFQHLKTLTRRFAAFPIRAELISRFRSRADQKSVLADLEAGKVDIIVGTHRLLSKDVRFRDLGLLIVDEEQRFGVTHKERIKQMRKRVDVLTMTATPIPRTLNMSLVGIRDMSIIQTPPKDRQSIQTSVVTFDTALVAKVIRREIERGGQVYFVHNRVQSIYALGDLVRRLVPEARIALAHGQMNEGELERVMVDFVDRQYDVLLATTIIENGLDIPNANTMIVNRADRYGLAQLYQLRGRVGRSDRRAYAYLLIPPEDSLSAIARKRLAAIREFSDLGSGFRIAALDLELRGAGNLLGGEQSGHIEAIGFEMYMKLLDQTIRELKGSEIDDGLRAAVNLHVDLRIGADYIPDTNQRLSVYRRIAGARDEAEVDGVVSDVRDRYGTPPESVLNLADYGRIRAQADRLRIETLDRKGSTIVVTFRSDTRVDPRRLLTLVERRDDLTLVPPATLRMALTSAPRPVPREGRPAARAGSHAGRRRLRRESSGASHGQSWWTARAQAGAVEPGFSKASMEREAREDPRAPGGLLERAGALLAELSQASDMG